MRLSCVHYGMNNSWTVAAAIAVAWSLYAWSKYMFDKGHEEGTAAGVRVMALTAAGFKACPACRQMFYSEKQGKCGQCLAEEREEA